MLGVLTLTRWPLRVMAEAPVFQPTEMTDVLPMVAGTVDRVLVREGMIVSAGDPIVQLRDVEARAARARASAIMQAAAQALTLAASRGDAAQERLQRILEESARAELPLRDEALSTTTLRAPVRGVVLTSRSELKLDARLQSGETFLQLGRTDSLERSRERWRRYRPLQIATVVTVARWKRVFVSTPTWRRWLAGPARRVTWQRTTVLGALVWSVRSRLRSDLLL